MMMQHNFFPTVGAIHAPGPQVTVRVALIDRRSGAIHSLGGHPVIVSATDPEAASAMLMRNRDPRVWSTLVLR